MCSTFDHFDELNVIDDQQYGELVIEDFYETEGAVNDDEEVLFVSCYYDTIITYSSNLLVLNEWYTFCYIDSSR